MVYRQVCTVIQELRDYMDVVLPEDTEYQSYRRHTFALLEEMQSLANRMESHLYAGKDLRELSAEVKELQALKDELEEEVYEDE
jgi:hypothetical protein